MIKHFVIIAILVFQFFFFTDRLFAQNYHKIDSLEKVLSNLPALNGTEGDTLRMKIINAIGFNFINNVHDSAEYWYSFNADTVINKNTSRKNYYKSNALRNLGVLYYYKNDFKKAILYFTIALKISEGLNDLGGISKSYNNLGLMYYYMGDYYKAIPFYENSLRIEEDIHDTSGVTKCLGNLGLVCTDQGNYNKALEYYLKSIRVSNDIGDVERIAVNYNNIGLMYMYQGDFPKALNYFEKSLNTGKDINNLLLITAIYNNCGFVYDNQGNYPKALEYYNKALEVSKNIEDKMGISGALLNLGILNSNLENYEKSLNYYEKSLNVFEEIGDKKGIALCYSNLGNAYFDKGNLDKAIEFHNKSLKINTEQDNKRGIAYCLTNLGDVYERNKNYNLAIEYYLKSIKIEEELLLLNNLAFDYPRLAFVYFKEKQYHQAADLYIKAIILRKKMIFDNFSILTEKEKGDFLLKTGKVFNSLSEFAMITKSDSIVNQCYDNELLLKGLLLNSSSILMTEINISKDTSLTNTYWKFRQLRSKVSELQSTPIEERKFNLDSIEKLANEEESKLVKLSKDFANIQKQYSYKWQEVQKNLQPKDVAIEFIKINYTLNRPVGVKKDSMGYAALILRKDSKNPQMVNLCSESSLQKMVGDLSWSEPSLLKMIYQIDSKKGLRLYNFIWKPLEQYLVGISNIYFAPVGILNQISFAAIPTPDHKFLSDIYKLNLVSSTRVLIEGNEKEKLKFEDAVVYGGIKYDSDSLFIHIMAQNNKTDETALRGEFKQTDSSKKEIKIWDYLAGTEMEGNKISDLLKKKKISTTYYSGYNGLEEKFKENKTSPSIIHIATHGFCFPTPIKGQEYTLFENSFVHNLNPLFRSGLLFAGANHTWNGSMPVEGVEDGILTAYEVSNLNLSNTKLVVLSACETGLGDLKGDEGVYGLQRAFKMAGVKYIVMSLWQVPDAQTEELMEYFYKELLLGKPIRDAFGKAQNKMKEKYEAYYWAGFVLVE